MRVDHKFTLYRKTTRRMPLKGDSRVPSIADRMCTIAEMGDELLSPSNVFGLRSRQTSVEYSVLKMASQLYTPPRIIQCPTRIRPQADRPLDPRCGK